MKIFGIVLAVLTSILAGVYLLLFTHSGNTFLKPYIEDKLTKELGQKVQLLSFTLKSNFIDTEMLVNDDARLVLNGEFGLFAKNFNIDYEIDAKQLETPFMKINNQMDLKGKVAGNLHKFKVDGSGKAFRSNVQFSTLIKEKMAQDIMIQAKGLKIEDILAFANQPIYSRGMLDVNVDVKSIGPNIYKGTAKTLIHYGTLELQVIKDTLNILLPQAVTYKGAINANIDGDVLKAASEITSNVAKITTSATEFNTKNKSFYSDYVASIPNLGFFGNLIDLPLQGNIKFDGNVKKDAKELAFNANSNFLGGKLVGVLLNDTLKLDAMQMSIAQLLWTFKQPKYAKGLASLHVDVDGINGENKIGTVKMYTKEAKALGKNISKLLDKQINEDIDFVVDTSSDIKGNKVESIASLKTSMFDLKLDDLSTDLKSTKTNGKYALHVEDLQKLKTLSGMDMQGKFDTIGTLEYGKDGLLIDGKSDSFDAKTAYTFANNKLSFNSEELSTTVLSEVLMYPKVFESFAQVQADYDIEKKEGAFVFNALNGKLLQSELTNIVQLISKFDLTQEIYKDSVLKGIISGDDLDFSMELNGMESFVKIPKGYVNLKNKNIESDFTVKVEHRDFAGSIQGSLDKPKVELDSSEYLKQKIDKAIDKKVPEKFKEPVKELLKLFG